MADEQKVADSVTPACAREPEALARILVAKMLGELPADQARVLRMHHLEDLTFPEIAAIEGISTGEAKGWARRAMVGIRRASLGGAAG